ncbi:MAG: hypothetical protein ACQ9MH_11705 [Nitrospinales bacterium]
MTTDLTFITNDDGKNLQDRFNKLVKDTRFFDVMVGYFYTSGFYAIYPQLEKTENIRIKRISFEDQKPFIELVNQILAITSIAGYDPKNPPERQKELENEVDELVMDLYELTNKEKK